MNIWYWGWQEATTFMIIIRFIDSSLDIFDWALNQQTIWNDNINLTANKVNLLLNKYWTVQHKISFSIKVLKNLIYEIYLWYKFCIFLLIAIKVSQQSIKNSKWSLITPSSCFVTYSGNWNDPSWERLMTVY